MGISVASTVLSSASLPRKSRDKSCGACLGWQASLSCLKRRPEPAFKEPCAAGKQMDRL